MFYFTDQLNQLQRQAVENLALRCKKTDGNCIPVYGEILLQKRNERSNVLWYEGKTLIGFCSIFFFHKGSCEISLIVAPKHRRQGKAKQMFEAVKTIINEETIHEIFFSCPKDQGHPWLPAYHLNYKGSEYQMIRDSRAPLKTIPNPFHFRMASVADIDLICAIDSACFLSGPNEMRAHFLTRLSQPNYLIFLMYEDDNFIGKAHLNQGQESIHLSDVCITPEKQGRGFGRILMTHCINTVLSHNKLPMTLNVETANEHALHLYQHLGFILKNAHDYWTLSLEKSATK